MNNNRDGDEDFSPQWPQRPSRPQPEAMRPRLDPPLDRGRMPQQNTRPGDNGGNTRPPSSSSSSAWTSHPTSQDPNPGPEVTKETRVLPVVQPSRFDNGRQGSAQAPQEPVSGRRQVEPAPRQEPKKARDAYEAYDARPETPAAQRPAQPQPRKAGGWQYERDDDQDRYNDATREYSPVQFQQRQQRQQQQAYGQVPRVTVQGGKWDNDAQGRYLSMDIDGVKKRRGGWILWVFALLLLIVAIGAAAFSLAWQGQYAGKVFAGVSVLGMDVGGKSQDEVRKMIVDKVQPFLAQPVVFSWQNKEWRPSADQIGIKIDADQAVNEAFQVGRSSDFFSNIGQQWSAAQSGYRVPVTVQFSEPTLQGYLDTIAKNEINQDLFEGDVRLNGAQIDARPGKEGRSLRVYDTITQVRDAVAKLDAGKKIDLAVDVTQPTVSADEVAQVSKQLAVRISSPITATAAGKVMTLDTDALIRFTTIERDPDRTAKKHINLGWKDNELKILADKWVSDANHSAQNARFAWNNGAVSVIKESADGFQTDSASVMNAIEAHADTTDKRQFDLPGKVITPTVSSKDIASLGIKELMGTGTSTFRDSSPERATNIKVASDLLNGAVVAPGAAFSFLDTMGGIDEAHGFVEGYVIAAERTQKGVGGGVCQVSTTTFRAAFWSGVQITERNQHSYRVGWYEANGEPVGFDAAVFDPGVDLKFVNNSPGYILVQTQITSDNLLVVNFYGTKTPGTVKLEGPVISNRTPPPPDVYEVDPRLPAGTKKQVETAHAGLDTLITRRIVVDGQPDKVDKFPSHYQAWPNWYIVASPSQIPPGAQTPSANPTPNP